MFDGTELSLVYGDMQEPEIQQQQIQEPPQKIKQQPLTPQPEAMYQQQQPEPKLYIKNLKYHFGIN